MSTKLVIVESPAKARTLARFLGKGYRVEASIGHVRDLPKSAAEIPPKVKKEAWARLGVNVEAGFEPLYVVPSSKKEQVRKLRALLKDADTLYLATDEDREGESISWHLVEVLKPKVPTKRLVFHEITKEAIQEALSQVRDIDLDLVRAQETRRIVDRLYGYVVSPLLWKKVKPKLSAGRVQSVAVRLVVERERARIAFRRAVYWDLSATLRKGDAAPFTATLSKVGGRRIATGKDFDAATGKMARQGDAAPLLLGEIEAAALKERISRAAPTVAGVGEAPFTERPAPPFTTSTLQQDANRKMRFSARRTMDLAQKLYENGFITYMRTDSTTLSNEALRNARQVISDSYGAEFLPDAPRTYKNKVKNAQEAHEAIRPAGAEGFTKPDQVESALGQDARRLYELIYRRTLASQMPDAKGHRVSVEVALDDATFTLGGKVYHFLGFKQAWGSEGDDRSDSGRLPPLSKGDALELLGLESKDHTTQPPARLTEATLVRDLEALGIGRPSTYAAIIDTILRREYVRKQGSALAPTFTAFAVVNLMEQWLSYLVDYGFTKSMEDDLDAISLGNLDQQVYLERFYNGNGQPGLKGTLVDVETKIDPREVCGVPLGEHEGTKVEVRVGRYGPFLSSGDVRASLPDDIVPDELTLERAVGMLAKAAEGPRVVGHDAESGNPVYAKTGRYGPYVQLGDPTEDSDEKPKMASLLEGMEAETVTLEEALGLLSLPRTLGQHPTSDAPVQATNGRYGPYVLCEKETRSLPAGLSPLLVTFEQALELLNKPKERGARRSKREPLKELGKHPDSGEPVKVLDG
ncbi:MAG: DNA topoisomerase I, partial [Planctomycetes bacterium]|nr:DNA topoisomerase I [Planctomycetota bacterium]